MIDLSPVLTAVHPAEVPAPEIWSPPSPLLCEALDDGNTGVLIFNEDFHPVHITSQVRPLLGFHPEHRMGGLDVLQLLSASGLDDESAALARDLVSGNKEEAVFLKAHNETNGVRMRLRALGNGYRLASFERTGPERGAGIQRPNNSVEIDWLTGLPSRQALEMALTEALTTRPEEPLSLILLDLDRFKAVNDTLGHPAGDALLRLVAERISSALRKTDMAARLGGDEFALLIYPSLSMTEPTAIANRILEIVQRTYLIEGQLVNVGTSLGIAISPEHGTTCETLMRNADLALYHSKTSGRATFHFFHSKMELRAQARRTSELELRRALALRQLELHYQPQIDIRTGMLVGFEALVRWRHPEKGLIPPGDFLPLAEEIGVIIPLGEWALRTACRQAMQWEEHVVIAVNASPIQFDTGRFAEVVASVLKSTGLPGHRLEIEITEGLLLRNESTVLTTLYQLREMKVRIAMDDFGTGYASLSQLAYFPFDKIKIDRSLSGNGGHNPKNRAIVRAIAALGESLGVSTMAEGVETAEQLDRLQVDGCNSVQGYYFSKAVPASELTALISTLNKTSRDLPFEKPQAENQP